MRLKVASVLYDTVLVEGLIPLAPEEGEEESSSFVPWDADETSKIQQLPWIQALPFYMSPEAESRARVLTQRAFSLGWTLNEVHQMLLHTLAESAEIASDYGSALSISADQEVLMRVLIEADMSQALGGDGPLFHLDSAYLGLLDWSAIGQERESGGMRALRDHLSELYALGIEEANNPGEGRQRAIRTLVKDLSSYQGPVRAVAESSSRNGIGYGISLIPVIGPIVAGFGSVAADVVGAARRSASWVGALHRHLS